MVATNDRLPLSVEGIERALVRSKEGHVKEYLDSLRARVAAYEKRYEMPSDMLLSALSARKIKEDLDIVKWLHAHETLMELENGRGNARLEHA